MINQLTFQDITCQGYSMPSYDTASKAEDIDTNEVPDILRKVLYYVRYASLSSSKIDVSSVKSSHFPEAENRTSPIKEDVWEEDASLSHVRISEIVNKLIKERKIFKNIDKTNLIKFLSTLTSTEELNSVDNKELKRRVEKIMLIETMGGILNELNPEQIKDFDSAVKRRDFFK